MKSGLVSRWAIAWSLIAVVAFGIGIIARMSHGDVSSHPEELDRMEYQVAPFSQKQFELYAEGVGDLGTKQALKDADIVVRVKKEGVSTYRYKAFTAPVRGVEFLRGDAQLQDLMIDVYEPVSLNEWDGVKTLFTADAYQFGSTPMRENEEYVLFLNRAPSNRVVGDAWTIAVSPYAKMPADGDPVCIVHAGVEANMILRDLSDADLIAESDADAAAYLAGSKDVLESFAIE